jgi:hypothetical protein
MKTQLLCIAMLASACTTLDRPGFRRTHEDRWRDAAARFEADLKERGVAEPASQAAPGASTQTRRHVMVVPAEESARGWHSTYDVQDLVTPRPSFAAPELGLLVSGAERADHAALLPSSAVIDGDTLAETIRVTIDPGSWDEDGNSGEVVDGRLYVRRKGDG